MLSPYGSFRAFVPLNVPLVVALILLDNFGAATGIAKLAWVSKFVRRISAEKVAKLRTKGTASAVPHRVAADKGFSP